MKRTMSLLLLMTAVVARASQDRPVSLLPRTATELGCDEATALQALVWFRTQIHNMRSTDGQEACDDEAIDFLVDVLDATPSVVMSLPDEVAEGRDVTVATTVPAALDRLLLERQLAMHNGPSASSRAALTSACARRPGMAAFRSSSAVSREEEDGPQRQMSMLDDPAMVTMSALVRRRAPRLHSTGRTGR